MGRQINYYMEYESFLQVARLALDCGCEIIKEDLSVRPTTVIRTRDIAAITPNDWMFWFYVPEAGRSKRKHSTAANAWSTALARAEILLLRRVYRLFVRKKKR